MLSKIKCWRTAVICSFLAFAILIGCLIWLCVPLENKPPSLSVQQNSKSSQKKQNINMNEPVQKKHALSEKAKEELDQHLYFNEESKKLLLEIRQTLLENQIQPEIFKKELQRAIAESVDGKLSFEEVAETFPEGVREKFIHMMKTIVTHVEKKSGTTTMAQAIPPEPTVDPEEITHQQDLSENDLYIIETGQVIRAGTTEEKEWVEVPGN